MIDHARELRHARLQAQLPILVVEEARILEPRPHDALVPGDDMARVGDRHVRDDEKARQQMAGAVEQREVFLVLPHRED